MDKKLLIESCAENTNEKLEHKIAKINEDISKSKKKKKKRSKELQE